MKEASAKMTPEKALSTLTLGDEYIVAMSKQKVKCDCGACRYCAFVFLENLIKPEKKREIFIQFREHDQPRGYKTKVWGIYTKDENPILLGLVRWETGWRKYAFFPMNQTLYEEDCLEVISEFLKQKTSERRAERARERVHERQH